MPLLIISDPESTVDLDYHKQAHKELRFDIKGDWFHSKCVKQVNDWGDHFTTIVIVGECVYVDKSSFERIVYVDPDEDVGAAIELQLEAIEQTETPSEEGEFDFGQNE